MIKSRVRREKRDGMQTGVNFPQIKYWSDFIMGKQKGRGNEGWEENKNSSGVLSCLVLFACMQQPHFLKVKSQTRRIINILSTVRAHIRGTRPAKRFQTNSKTTNDAWGACTFVVEQDTCCYIHMQKQTLRCIYTHAIDVYRSVDLRQRWRLVMQTKEGQAKSLRFGLSHKKNISSGKAMPAI